MDTRRSLAHRTPPAAGLALALAALLLAGAPARADPGDKGNRMQGGEARSESAEPAPPPPRAQQPGPPSGVRQPAPRAAPPPTAPTPGSAQSGDGRPPARSSHETRRRDGGEGWTPRPGTPRLDGGPDSPAADPATGALPDPRRQHGNGRTDRARPNGDRASENDRRANGDGSAGRGGASSGDPRRDRDYDDRDRRDDRNDWRRGSHSDPRYSWHWRSDPRWRFDPRWGFFDPFWRFDWQWGWYDPRWGWNPRWGYDPRWGWGGPYGFGFDWRLGVRAETAITQDPVLRRWALVRFDRNRDGRLDPDEVRRAAWALEDVADLNGNGRLDAREIAFARAEIERFGWEQFGAGQGFGEVWR